MKEVLTRPPNPGAAEVMSLGLSDPDSEALLKLCALLPLVLLALNPPMSSLRVLWELKTSSYMVSGFGRELPDKNRDSLVKFDFQINNNYCF